MQSFTFFFLKKNTTTKTPDSQRLAQLLIPILMSNSSPLLSSLNAFLLLPGEGKLKT